MAERERNLCAEALNALTEAYKEYRDVRDNWRTIAINLSIDPTIWSSDLYRGLAVGDIMFKNSALCRYAYCIPLDKFVETHLKYTEKRRALDLAMKESRGTCEAVSVREIDVE